MGRGLKGEQHANRYPWLEGRPAGQDKPNIGAKYQERKLQELLEGSGSLIRVSITFLQKFYHKEAARGFMCSQSVSRGGARQL
jgi:hypothetical protein